MDNEYKEPHLIELFNNVEEENSPPYSLIFIIVAISLLGLSFINPAFLVLLIIAGFFGLAKLIEFSDELETTKYKLTPENDLNTVLKNHITQKNIVKLDDTGLTKVPHYKLVLQEMKSDIDIIQNAANGANADLSDNLNAIIITTKKIEDEINLDNSNFSQVERVFTYYVPQMVKLLNARGIAIRAKNNNKILEIDEMFIRLRAVVQNYANRIYEDDMREIDIDLKLLEQSLAQDLQFETRIKNNR